ncbi:WD40 repeat-like protein [Hortaea werneckii]|nr:WD40 repeat-like protein [Hortaea werneckii]
MLAEHIIASIGVPEKVVPSNVAKDAAIFIHEAQPIQQPKAVFKKSATPPNCLAVSSTHIFAAQTGKAVVHVYSREKGNQEATIPFTERITCLTLACEETVLVLGTAEGRCFLWETATGRLVTTAQSHLQAVTKVHVDSTNNFLLSASEDSTVHVWNLPGLLSFSNAGDEPPTPLRTFTAHRAGIVDLALGHSGSFTNFVVTISKDKSCLVWDYFTNKLLRTYLLPAMPRCLTLDAADRSIYIGYEDGSLHQLNLYDPSETGKLQEVHDQGISAPFQPSANSRWIPSDGALGSVLSLTLSFDSCTLLAGHETGSILAWDVASGRTSRPIIQAPLPGPVTNLDYLPVIGFATSYERRIEVPTVVKPRFGVFDNADGSVPGNYAITAQLRHNLSSAPSAFEQALTAPCFPQSLIDEGLGELASWGDRSTAPASQDTEAEPEDFMALDEPETSQKGSAEEEVAELKKQLESLRRLQNASFDKIEKLSAERKTLLQRERKRSSGGKKAQKNGVSNLESSSDED